MSEAEFDIKEFKRVITFDESPQRRAAFFVLNMMSLGLSGSMSMLPMYYLLLAGGWQFWHAFMAAVLWGVGIRMLITVYLRRKYHWTKINVTYTRKVSHGAD